MIFGNPLYGKVLRGEKSMTRRLVTSRDLDTKYRVGMRKAVQRGRGVHGEAHIILTDVRREQLDHKPCEKDCLGDPRCPSCGGAGESRLTIHDARAEGFKTTDDFRAYWVELHDSTWDERQRDLIEAEPSDVDRDRAITRRELARFDARWAHKEVWVLTFALDHSERPRLLADRNARADYVESPGRALADPDPGEAVDARTADQYAREGHQGWVARERARELDRELLTAEERMRLVRFEARAKGVDIDHLEAAILQRVRAAERKVHRKAA